MSGINEVTIDGVVYTRSGDHLDGDGTFYPWISGEDHVVVADDTTYIAEWDGDSETFTLIPVVDSTTVVPEADDEPETPDTADAADAETSEDEVNETETTENEAGEADSTSAPQTGDNSSTALWIALMLAAVVGLTGTIVYVRKRR